MPQAPTTVQGPPRGAKEKTPEDLINEQLVKNRALMRERLADVVDTTKGKPEDVVPPNARPRIRQSRRKDSTESRT